MSAIPKWILIANLNSLFIQFSENEWTVKDQYERERERNRFFNDRIISARQSRERVDPEYMERKGSDRVGTAGELNGWKKNQLSETQWAREAEKKKSSDQRRNARLELDARRRLLRCWCSCWRGLRLRVRLRLDDWGLMVKGVEVRGAALAAHPLVGLDQDFLERQSTIFVRVGLREDVLRLLLRYALQTCGTVRGSCSGS